MAPNGNPDQPSSTADPGSWLQTRVILKALLTILTVAAVLWLVYALRTVLLLVVLAVIFSYLLAPLIDVLHRLLRRAIRDEGVAHLVALSVVYLILFGGIGVGAYLVAPHLGNQISALAQEAPTLVAALRARGQSLSTFYHSDSLSLPVRGAIESAAAQAAAAAGGWIREGALSAAGGLRFLPWLVLIPVLSFFLLKDAGTLRSLALEALPRGRTRWRGSDLFEEVNQTLASFVRSQLLACVFIGVACGIGLAVIRVPYALALGLGAAVLEFIPIIGPATFAATAALIASREHHLVATLAFLAVLRFIHDYAVYPRLIGRGLRLHPLAIILAIVCGSQLGGLAGLFLGIPMIAVGSVVYRFLKRHIGKDQLVAGLLRTQEPVHVPVLSRSSPAPSEQSPGKRERPQLPSLGGVTVLVVDNDAEALETLALVLEGCGATVVAAGSAAEALVSIRAHRPDVLLSDIGMPDEDGLDLIRQVRQLDEDQGSILPAAAVTGYATEEDRQRIMLAGFQAHLQKPVNLPQLIRLVLQLARPVPTV